MGLIRVPEHRPEDLTAWESLVRQDVARALQRAYRRKPGEAGEVIRSFVKEHPHCYTGVSWGKDSVVLADLIALHAPQVPLVYIRVQPVENPHCALVRDAFLSHRPGLLYEEIIVECERGEDGDLIGTGRLEQGFKECEKRHGIAHLSGVRGEESGTRSKRMHRWGTTSINTCAPLGWWRAEDIFAYLHERNLPVHPAYAMSHGGLLDRRRLRVASLGGQRGTGHGRAEWEREYYGWRLDEIDRLATRS